MSDDNVITQTGTSNIKSITITDTICSETFIKFLTFHRDNVEKGVTEAFIYIDSPGGYVHAYKSIQAIIDSGEVTYHTVAMGMACSCACLMSGQGQFRWAIPNCEFMFHDVAYGTWGKLGEIEEGLEVVKRFSRPVLEQFANNTNKPLKWWMARAQERESRDFFFTAEEALEWGVIDFIGLPMVDKQPQLFVELPVSANELTAKVKARQAKPKDTPAKKKVAKKAAKKKQPKKKEQ
jgi:ATP-dependent Clp protease protease subunit